MLILTRKSGEGNQNWGGCQGCNPGDKRESGPDWHRCT